MSQSNIILKNINTNSSDIILASDTPDLYPNGTSIVLKNQIELSSNINLYYQEQQNIIKPKIIIIHNYYLKTI